MFVSMMTAERIVMVTPVHLGMMPTTFYVEIQTLLTLLFCVVLVEEEYDQVTVVIFPKLFWTFRLAHAKECGPLFPF